MDSKLTGKIIASKRKEKGLNQIQLGELLNVSNRTISKWENGDGFPDISLLPEISKTLDITIDELLTGEPPKPVIKEVIVNDKKNSSNSKYKFVISEIISFAFIIVATIIGASTEVALFHKFPFYAFIEIYLIVGAAILITAGIIVFFTGLVKYKAEAVNLPPSTLLHSYILVLIASFSPACVIFRICSWLDIYDIDGFLVRYIFAGVYIVSVIVSAVIVSKKYRKKSNEK